MLLDSNNCDDDDEASLPFSCMSVLIVCLQMQVECFDGRGVCSSRPGMAEGPWLAGVHLLQFAHAICRMLSLFDLCYTCFKSACL